MSYSVRESVTEITTTTTTSSAGVSEIKAPTMSWEQFVLINVEMDRLGGLLRNVCMENEGLRSKISFHITETERIRIELSQSRKEIETLRNNKIIAELEAKNYALTQEVRSLSLALSTKVLEIETWNVRCTKLERTIEELTRKYEITIIENQKLVTQYKEMYVTELVIKEKQVILITELQTRITSLSTEHEKIIIALSNKVKELESHRDTMSLKSKEVQELKVQVAHIVQLNVKIEHLKTEHTKLTQKIFILNATLAQKNEQIQKLTIRAKEADALEIKYTKIVEETRILHITIKKTETELTELRSELLKVGQVEQKVALLFAEKQRIAQQATHLEGHLKNLADDKEKLNEVVISKRQENEELKQKMAVVPELEDKLDLAHKDKQALIKLLKEKETIISQLEIKISEYEEQLALFEGLKGKQSLLISENQRLNVVLSEKIKEIEVLQVVINEKSILEEKQTVLLEDKEQLTVTLEEKTQELVNLHKETERLEKELIVVPELEEKVTVITIENERLTEVLIEKETVIEEWQMRYEALEQLYDTVKETTEHLDKVRRKYQEAVSTSERVNAGFRTTTTSKQTVTSKQATVTTKKAVVVKQGQVSESEALTAESESPATPVEEKEVEAQ